MHCKSLISWYPIRYNVLCPTVINVYWLLSKTTFQVWFMKSCHKHFCYDVMKFSHCMTSMCGSLPPVLHRRSWKIRDGQLVLCYSCLTFKESRTLFLNILSIHNFLTHGEISAGLLSFAWRDCIKYRISNFGRFWIPAVIITIRIPTSLSIEMTNDSEGKAEGTRLQSVSRSSLKITFSFPFLRVFTASISTFQIRLVFKICITLLYSFLGNFTLLLIDPVPLCCRSDLKF